MFLTWESQLGALIMAVICGFAAWTGGRPQRVTAAVIAAAWIGSAALEDRRYIHPQYAIFVLDVVAAVVFSGLALIWRRSWLMAIAAFQLLTMATHIASMLDTRIWPLAYMTAYLVWSYLLLAAMAWGGVTGYRERQTLTDR